MNRAPAIGSSGTEAQRDVYRCNARNVYRKSTDSTAALT
jgi:hypothetical protein